MIISLLPSISSFRSLPSFLLFKFISSFVNIQASPTCNCPHQPLTTDYCAGFHKGGNSLRCLFPPSSYHEEEAGLEESDTILTFVHLGGFIFWLSVWDEDSLLVESSKENSNMCWVITQRSLGFSVPPPNSNGIAFPYIQLLISYW